MARTFNGTSDYIDGAIASAEPLTIAAWFQKVSLAATTAIVSIDTNGGVPRATLVASLTSGGVVSASSTNSGGTSSSSFGGNYSANTWTHGAGVFTNSTSRLAYTNGVAGTLDATSIVISGMDHVHIGARYNTTRGAFHDGRITEIGIWNVALTAEEIAALAKGFSPRRIRPQNLVFCTPLIRDVHDLKGLTLTTTGTTVSDHPRVF